MAVEPLQDIQNRLYQSQLANIMPSMRGSMRDVRMSTGMQLKRQGVVDPNQLTSRLLEGFGEQMGRASAGAATSSQKAGLQEHEFQRQLEIRREQMAQQQSQFEKSLAEQMASRQQQGQLGLLPYTGFTPEMMELLGMDFDRSGLGDWRQFQRTLGQYNLPGQPLGQGGKPQQLSAQQRLQLSMFYPGASRSYKAQAASNWGWTPPGQGYY